MSPASLDYLNRAAGQNVDIRSLSQALAAFGVDAGKAGDSLDMRSTWYRRRPGYRSTN